MNFYKKIKNLWKKEVKTLITKRIYKSEEPEKKKREPVKKVKKAKVVAAPTPKVAVPKLAKIASPKKEKITKTKPVVYKTKRVVHFNQILDLNNPKNQMKTMRLFIKSANLYDKDLAKFYRQHLKPEMRQNIIDMKLNAKEFYDLMKFAANSKTGKFGVRRKNGPMYDENGKELLGYWHVQGFEKKTVKSFTTPETVLTENLTQEEKTRFLSTAEEYNIYSIESYRAYPDRQIRFETAIQARITKLRNATSETINDMADALFAAGY